MMPRASATVRAAPTHVVAVNWVRSSQKSFAQR